MAHSFDARRHFAEETRPRARGFITLSCLKLDEGVPRAEHPMQLRRVWPVLWRSHGRSDMPEAGTHTSVDRERVLRKLVTSDPTFSAYRVVEVFESESGAKLTLVLVKKELSGRGSLANARDVL
jgi:hypothetical protein